MVNKFSESQFQKACENQGLNPENKEINEFVLKIKQYQENIKLLKPSKAFNSDNMTKLVENCINWIVICEYIEDNLNLYTSNTLKQEQDHYLKEPIYLFNQINMEEKNLFPTKKVEANLSLIHDSNQILVKVGLVLIDLAKKKADTKILKDDQNHILNLINSLELKEKKIEIDENKDSSIFAKIELVDNNYNICEKAADFLFATEWAYNFIGLQETYRKFYQENKLSFHYSYKASQDNLAFGLNQIRQNVAQLCNYLKIKKNRFESLLVDRVEQKDFSVWKKMVMTDKKIDKEILFFVGEILEDNATVIDNLVHKLECLTKKIAVDDLEQKQFQWLD